MFAFSALTLIGIRKSIWPVKNWVMRCWRGHLSGTRCKWFAYGPSDATVTPSSLKIQTGLTFLVPAYCGCPEKEAVERMSVFVQLW